MFHGRLHDDFKSSARKFAQILIFTSGLVIYSLKLKFKASLNY